MSYTSFKVTYKYICKCPHGFRGGMYFEEGSVTDMCES